MANRKRPFRIWCHLDEAELDLLEQKMAEAGIQNREAYIRKMILDGYVLKLDFSDVRHMVRLLSNATNNLNQIARHANQTGQVRGVRQLQADYDKLWSFARDMAKKMAKL